MQGFAVHHGREGFEIAEAFDGCGEHLPDGGAARPSIEETPARGIADSLTAQSGEWGVYQA